jgi:hypothetical protein
MANSADDIPQSERGRLTAEERRMRTYHGHAQANIDEDRGGRFAYSGSPTSVTGARSISYPAQPEGSPWHSDPIGTEPPLGIDINAQECVGGKWEQLSSSEQVTHVPVAESDAGSPALLTSGAGVDNGSATDTSGPRCSTDQEVMMQWRLLCQTK